MVQHMLGRRRAVIVVLIAIVVMVMLNMSLVLKQMLKASHTAALKRMRKSALRCSHCLQRK